MFITALFILGFALVGYAFLSAAYDRATEFKPTPTSNGWDRSNKRDRLGE